MVYQMMFNNPYITPSKLFQLSRGETDWGKQRESTPETGRSCVEEESHQHGAHWSNRGLVWFQIPGTTRAKLFLSGWISFLLSQVIQSVAVDVIVLVSSVGRERVDEGKSLPAAVLQRELTVRSWDESVTQRRRGEGEKTHIHLDRTKAYKCVRIWPRGISRFVCLKSLLHGFRAPGVSLRCLSVTTWFRDFHLS